MYVRVIEVKIPKHVKFSFKEYDDKIEFKMINTITGKEEDANYYFIKPKDLFINKFKMSIILNRMIQKVS
jgi:hypothetical protein